MRVPILPKKSSSKTGARYFTTGQVTSNKEYHRVLCELAMVIQLRNHPISRVFTNWRAAGTPSSRTWCHWHIDVITHWYCGMSLIFKECRKGNGTIESPESLSDGMQE